MKIIPRYIQQISIFSFLNALSVKKISFPDNFLFFNSCSGAIKWLLSEQRLMLKKQLNVGMPCYSCYTIYLSVSESDNTAVILDIDPMSFNITEKLNDQIKKLDVLLWINFFGFRYNHILREIRSRFPDLIIIEDCSHVDLRDYITIKENKLYSDFAVFSFNFRKPITAGGGGLLIPNAESNTEVSKTLHKSFSELPQQKLNAYAIIHILIYNFSYNYLIYFIFKKLISSIRNHPFKPLEMPISSLLMNRALKRLFYIQYLKISDKKKAENYTLNYFKGIPEFVKNYSFGSLSYFPVLSFEYKKIKSSAHIDNFILWDNLIISYKYFNIEISQDNFPLTISFLSKIVFLPARYFENPCESSIIFPGLLIDQIKI